jgi:hypothetical protein
MKYSFQCKYFKPSMDIIDTGLFFYFGTILVFQLFYC